MPTNQEMPNRNEASVQMPLRIGAAVLCLIAAGAFFFAYSYFSSIEPPAEAQAAAVVLADPFEDIRIAGTAAIVVDLTTGEILYEKNADAQLPLASLTKVALVAVIAESMPKEAQITIPYDTAATGNAQQLFQGEVLKLQDLIDFTLVASSNEGAEILSAAAERSVHAKYPQAPGGGATLWRMNNLASELGLQNTYFLNPTGLDESMTQSGAYGSARDVAKIFAYASATYPDVFAATSNNGRLVAAENGGTATITNTNEALGDIPGLVMGKTGFTDLAGGNLAVVFDVGLAHPVAAVVLGATRESRFADMKKLVKTARIAVTLQQ